MQKCCQQGKAQQAINSKTHSTSGSIFESQVLVNNNLRDYGFGSTVSTEDEIVVIVRDIADASGQEERYSRL